MYNKEWKNSMHVLVSKRRVILLISVLIFIESINSATWDCSNAPQHWGTFDIPNDCELYEEVYLSGSLTLTGNKPDGTLSIITAASGKRHFFNDGHALTLNNLKLTGGEKIWLTGTEEVDLDFLGGSILMYGSNRMLIINNCVVLCVMIV